MTTNRAIKKRCYDEEGKRCYDEGDKLVDNDEDNLWQDESLPKVETVTVTLTQKPGEGQSITTSIL